MDFRAQLVGNFSTGSNGNPTVEVIKHLDGLGESASVIGAVNCALLRDDKYIGENTDGK